MGDIRGKASNLKIPVIDIAKAAENPNTADQLIDAVARYGFVYIRGEGTGFSRPILDSVFALVIMKQFLPRLTMLTTLTVTEILLVQRRRERNMRYPNQCTFPVAWILLANRPISHIVLEHRLVVNAYRNFRSQNPKKRRLQRVDFQT